MSRAHRPTGNRPNSGQSSESTEFLPGEFDAGAAAARTARATPYRGSNIFRKAEENADVVNEEAEKSDTSAGDEAGMEAGAEQKEPGEKGEAAGESNEAGEEAAAKDDGAEAGREPAPKVAAKLESNKIHLAAEDDRKKPINLPSAKSITVDMAHIQSGHMAGGGRNLAGKKDVFPPHMDVRAVEAAVRAAYESCKKVETQGDRVRVIGTGAGLTIEMWVNVKTKTIETAYPKN